MILYGLGLIGLEGMAYSGWIGHELHERDDNQCLKSLHTRTILAYTHLMNPKHLLTIEHGWYLEHTAFASTQHVLPIERGL